MRNCDEGADQRNGVVGGLPLVTFEVTDVRHSVLEDDEYLFVRLFTQLFVHWPLHPTSRGTNHGRVPIWGRPSCWRSSWEFLCVQCSNASRVGLQEWPHGLLYTLPAQALEFRI